MQELLKNLQRAAEDGNPAVEDLIELMLRGAEELLSSPISYFATVTEGNVLTMRGWSKSAHADCSVLRKPIIYLIENTGLWGDCVRHERAVITNDYANSDNPNKKGYPDGHVHVLRHMNAPVSWEEEIVALVGVGNKTNEYTPADAQTLTEYGNRMWPLLVDHL
jgi:hypothetical protein